MANIPKNIIQKTVGGFKDAADTPGDVKKTVQPFVNGAIADFFGVDSESVEAVQKKTDGVVDNILPQTASDAADEMVHGALKTVGNGVAVGVATGVVIYKATEGQIRNDSAGKTINDIVTKVQNIEDKKNMAIEAVQQFTGF